MLNNYYVTEQGYLVLKLKLRGCRLETPGRLVARFFFLQHYVIATSHAD